MVVAQFTIHHQLQPVKTDATYAASCETQLHPTFCQLATVPVNLTGILYIIL
jgi:hypothetical protein